MDDVISRNLCNSCINNECIFQSGIVRNHCDFYKAEGAERKSGGRKMGKSLSSKEAITILNDMKVDIPVPKAAITQIKRNVALDMAINALICSEIPNKSDTISRQTAIAVADSSGYIKLSIDDVKKVIDEVVKGLKQLPSTQSILTCDGCRHVGMYDTDFPCNGCVRREKDYYDPER